MVNRDQLKSELLSRIDEIMPEDGEITPELGAQLADKLNMAPEDFDSVIDDIETDEEEEESENERAEEVSNG